MKVDIDRHSGFCFGVTRAIKTVEETLGAGGKLYCLGDIVHNSEEVSRLESIGLETINHEKYFTLSDSRVLLRAHGEPPETYRYAREHRIELIDATCPIVLRLQKKVREAYMKMKDQGGQVILYGTSGHAEVTGLAGQTGNQAIVIESEEDLQRIDPDKPSVLFSQTTKSPDSFRSLAEKLKARSTAATEVHDTICRQVSNRGPHLMSFAASHDIIIFAGGKKSSNARYLFDICKQVNPESYFVSKTDELSQNWFRNRENAGVCGATSTPGWLLEEIAEAIRQI